MTIKTMITVTYDKDKIIINRSSNELNGYVFKKKNRFS